MINDKYPIYNLTNILDQLGDIRLLQGCLAIGFLQIEMSEEDIQRNTFKIGSGYNEYVPVYFEVKNVPTTCPIIMDNILKESVFLRYIDELLIFSLSLREDIVKLKKGFQILCETNLKIPVDKSEILKKG